VISGRDDQCPEVDGVEMLGQIAILDEGGVLPLSVT